MMKKYLTLLLIIFLLAVTAKPGLAKGVYIHDSVGIEGPSSLFDLVVYNYFVNTYDTDILFRWDRINVNVPGNWETSVCIGDICYNPDVSTEMFTLEAGDTMDVLAHFYPYNQDGNGYHYVIIYPDTAGNDEAVSAKFQGIATKASTLLPDSRKQNLKITRLYPNPVSDQLSIQLLSISDYQITIYNILGEEVMTSQIRNNNTTNISVNHLNNGMYMISVTDLKSGNKITRTVSKH